MKKLTWTLLGLCLLALPSQAQSTPDADVSVQYSPLYILKGYTIWMNGVSGSVGHDVNNWFGVAGDFGAYRGHVPEAFTGETYMAGPRFTYHKFDRLIPFAQDLFVQGLFGGSHFSQSTGGITGGGTQFAFALGGGVDMGLGSAQKFALRPQLEYVGIRSAGATTPSVRLSIGIVYRIGQR
ncbi:MAG TPA: outer membrane beta-barrel protein [Terriglobales bacterium]|nr:outer membrane beta-barrel protein [Terriglobales bacterium]